jgi:hypothetical protein
VAGAAAGAAGAAVTAAVSNLPTAFRLEHMNWFWA